MGNSGVGAVVLTIAFTLSTASLVEPQCTCSKFHYEEQLLEKMIRPEIKYEDLQTSVQKYIGDMEQKYRAFVDSTTARFKRNQEQLDNCAELKTVMKNWTENIDQNVKKVSDKLMSRRTVLFNARKVADETLNDGETIVFTEIVYNHGQAYDNKTGVFTAPVAGTFLFTAHLCSTYKKSIHYRIVVDGKDITKGREYDNDAHVCTSFDAIVLLKADDKVWVGSTLNGDQLREDYNRQNTFSGVMLHEL